MSAFLNCDLCAELRDPLAIFGVKVILTECRFAQPLFDGKAKDAFRLFTDERKSESLGIGFPDNALDGVDEISKAPLCSDSFGAALIGVQCLSARTV